MTPDEYEKFFALLERLVNEDGSWRTKKAALKAHGSVADNMNVEELANWFEEEIMEAK